MTYLDIHTYATKSISLMLEHFLLFLPPLEREAVP